MKVIDGKREVLAGKLQHHFGFGKEKAITKLIKNRERHKEPHVVRRIELTATTV